MAIIVDLMVETKLNFKFQIRFVISQGMVVPHRFRAFHHHLAADFLCPNLTRIFMKKSSEQFFDDTRPFVHFTVTTIHAEVGKTELPGQPS